MLGISFAFGAAFFNTGKDFVSKKVASQVESITSTFASFVFALPFFLTVLVVLWLLGIEGFKVSTALFLLVILRSLSDVGAEWTKMAAFGAGDMSLVAPVIGTSPLFIVLMAPLITGDTVGWIAIIGILLIVCGTAIAAPSRKSKDRSVKAFFLALVSAFFHALNNCFDRLAVNQTSATFSGFLVTLGAALLFIIPVLSSNARRKDLVSNQKFFWLRGVFETCFMICKLSALQFLSPVYVVGLHRFSVVFSIIAGRVAFGEKHIGRRLIAGIFVVAGAVFIVADMAR